MSIPPTHFYSLVVYTLPTAVAHPKCIDHTKALFSNGLLVNNSHDDGMSGSGPNIQPGAVAQDLSWEDRQDLLAFIDKRNWFEAKLEVRTTAPNVNAYS